MYSLSFTSDWADQVARIRDDHTEDSNLIRFDNSFYRLCRDQDHTFDVLVNPGHAGGGGGVTLTVKVRDFYVTRVNGWPFERYASTLGGLSPQAASLDSAVQSLPKANGDDLFLKQSLLVFCVAESLRSDHVATRIGQGIMASTTGLVGVAPTLDIGAMLRIARTWGQASDAIRGQLPGAMQAILAQPRAALNPAQRRASARVRLESLPVELRQTARSIKVLKRPG